MTKTSTRRRTYTQDELESIFTRSKGICGLCDQRLVFEAYGKLNQPGGWHVDHSRAIARGGSNHPNNLVATHVQCNLKKGTRPRAEARAEIRQERAQRRNRLFGATTAVATIVLGIVKIIKLIGRR